MAKAKAARSSNKGLFVVFEGGEGAGKSTVLRAVEAAFQERGLTVVATREPGGTPLGLGLREVLLDAKASESPTPLAELLLYEADRAHHVATRIEPALAAGHLVLCDRHGDSSVVYQGMARGLGAPLVTKLNAIATGGRKADLTIVVDVPVEVGLARAKARSGGVDRIEAEDRKFHESVRRGFLRLAAKSPSRYLVLDGRKAATTLAAQAIAAVEKRWKKRGKR